MVWMLCHGCLAGESFTEAEHFVFFPRNAPLNHPPGELLLRRHVPTFCGSSQVPSWTFGSERTRIRPPEAGHMAGKRPNKRHAGFSCADEALERGSGIQQIESNGRMVESLIDRQWQSSGARSEAMLPLHLLVDLARGLRRASRTTLRAREPIRQRPAIRRSLALDLSTLPPEVNPELHNDPCIRVFLEVETRRAVQPQRTYALSHALLVDRVPHGVAGLPCATLSTAA
eukprot:scaffold733_cov267-Pinguiococcus_pyrenoidosus.AAC.62